MVYTFNYYKLGISSYFTIIFVFLDESVCSDIKLETEADDGSEIPTRLPVNMYHARRALRNAIIDWLPEFHRNRQASGK